MYMIDTDTVIVAKIVIFTVFDTTSLTSNSVSFLN